MHWYLAVLRKYAVFQGRARRWEYWTFILVNLLLTLLLVIVDAARGTLHREEGLGLFSSVYLLVVLLPTLAVSVRRLHDIDHSGWWFLIKLIPCIGSIVLLVLLARDGSSGENRFGPDPKA